MPQGTLDVLWAVCSSLFTIGENADKFFFGDLHFLCEGFVRIFFGGDDEAVLGDSDVAAGTDIFFVSRAAVEIKDLIAVVFLGFGVKKITFFGSETEHVSQHLKIIGVLFYIEFIFGVGDDEVRGIFADEIGIDLTDFTILTGK